MYDKEKKEYYCDMCNWRSKSWWRMQWHYFLHGLGKIPVNTSVIDFPSQYPQPKWLKIYKYDVSTNALIKTIKLGKQTDTFELNKETIYQFEYKNSIVLVNSIKFKAGQFGFYFYNQSNITGKRLRVFIIPNNELFPTTEEFKVFFNHLISKFKVYPNCNKTLSSTESRFPDGRQAELPCNSRIKEQ